MRLASRLKRAVFPSARSHEAVLPGPVLGRAPGTARASMFFDAFPRFYETSETGPHRGRLNLRYEAIFGENRDIFAGVRVLDIASHDGRWSLAALEAGATEVIGIEAREDLVRAARRNLEHYSKDGRAYRFIAGDVFEVLGRAKLDVNVVLCLGYLYHTLRYNELMHRIREIDPRHLVLDTQVIPQLKHPFVRLRLDRAERQRNAVLDPYSYGDKTVVGWPSMPAVRLLVEAYGFEIERFSDWPALLRDNPELGGIDDYSVGRRVTLRCTSTG